MKRVTNNNMKKAILTILTIFLITTSVFASSIGITLGVTSAYQKARLGEVKTVNVEELKWEDFKYGADLSVKLLILELNTKSFIAKDTDSNTLLNGIISANVAIDIAFVRAKAGLGYQYTYDTISKEYLFGRGVNNYADFKNAEFDIYTGADIRFGNIVFGIYGTLPTSVSIEKNNWNEIVSTISDNWEDAQVGISLGVDLI